MQASLCLHLCPYVWLQLESNIQTLEYYRPMLCQLSDAVRSVRVCNNVKAVGSKWILGGGGGAGNSGNLGGSGGMYPQIILKCRTPKYGFQRPGK